MTRPAAPLFDDLPPETQADLRKRYDIGSAQNQPATIAQQERQPTAAQSQAGRKRKETGANFEAELDVTHAAYEFKKYGKIRRNHIPTKIVGAPRRGIQPRVPTGPAHVDRTGWVSVDGGRPGSGIPWCGVAFNAPCVTKRIIPVAFDAKVLSEKSKRGWYTHDATLQHQLHDLKAAADAGEFAFLFVHDRAVERVFAIPILDWFVSLLRDGVQLYDYKGKDVPPLFLLPSIEKRDQDGLGVDWIPLLQFLAP